MVELQEDQKDLNFTKEFGEREFAVYAKDASERLAHRIMSRSLPPHRRDSRFNLRATYSTGSTPIPPGGRGSPCSTCCRSWPRHLP